MQVYGKLPGLYGQANTLICHVSGFHPPDISIELLKDGVMIPEAKQTDLAFEQTWQFHLTKSVPFTPMGGEVYGCRVKHQGKAAVYSWGECTVLYLCGYASNMGDPRTSSGI